MYNRMHSPVTYGLSQPEFTASKCAEVALPN
jgi:hypothetical protein